MDLKHMFLESLIWIQLNSFTLTFYLLRQLYEVFLNFNLYRASILAKVFEAKKKN